MAIERLELEVSLRDGRGKSVTRKLRAAGQIPAVVYGSGISPTAICVESLALAKEQEEALLFRAMQSDIVSQVMRRLDNPAR